MSVISINEIVGGIDAMTAATQKSAQTLKVLQGTLANGLAGNLAQATINNLAGASEGINKIVGVSAAFGNVSKSIANISQNFQDLKETVATADNTLNDLAKKQQANGLKYQELMQQQIEKIRKKGDLERQLEAAKDVGDLQLITNLKNEITLNDRVIKGIERQKSQVSSLMTKNQEQAKSIGEIKTQAENASSGFNKMKIASSAILPIISAVSVAVNLFKDIFLSNEEAVKSLKARFQDLSTVELNQLKNEIDLISHNIGIGKDEAVKLVNVLSNFQVDNSNLETAMGAISAIATTTGQSMDDIGRRMGQMLQNPLKNLEAMKKQGFIISNELKANLEANNAMLKQGATEAQKAIIKQQNEQLILNEITGQFGTSAAAGEGVLTASFANLDASLTKFKQNIFSTGSSLQIFFAKVVDLISTTIDVAGVAIAKFVNQAHALYRAFASFDSLWDSLIYGIRLFVNVGITAINGLIEAINLIPSINIPLVPTLEIAGYEKELKKVEEENLKVKPVLENLDFSKLKKSSAVAGEQAGKNISKGTGKGLKETSKQVDEALKKLQELDTQIANLGKSEIELKVQGFEALANASGKVQEFKDKLITLEIGTETQKIQDEINKLGKTELQIKMEVLKDAGASEQQLKDLEVLNEKLNEQKSIIDLQATAQEILNEQKYKGLTSTQQELAKLQEQIKAMQVLAETAEGVEALRVLQEKEKDLLLKDQEETQKAILDNVNSTIGAVGDLDKAWSKSGDTMGKVQATLQAMLQISQAMQTLEGIKVSSGVKEIGSQSSSGSLFSNIGSIFKSGFEMLNGTMKQGNANTASVAKNTVPIKQDTLQTLNF